MNNISEYLRKNDIKPSFQRMKIYEYLMKEKNHPTVEMIHSELVREIPTLSKTTIYNTLNLFVEKKIVLMVVIEEHETRYDTHLKAHGHFKCTGCGCIHDVEIEERILDIEGLKGFKIDEKHLYYKGTCDKCL